MWFVTRYDDVVSVLRDWQTFTTDSSKSPIRSTFGAQMLSTDGPERRRYRTEAQPSFASRSIRQEWQGPIEETCADLIDGFSDRGESDLLPDFASRLSVLTVAMILGLPADDESRLRSWYDSFARALADFSDDPEVREPALEAAEKFRTYLGRRIEEFRKKPDTSLLSRFAQACPERMSEEEIFSNVMIILFGGIETTESMLLNALWALFRHPAQLQEVLDRPALLGPAIEESLRWEPAVQSCTRWATRPVELCGVRIETGDTVQCMLGAANRDPSHFADPDNFDIHRANADEHLAFGAGRHVCVGSALARLETEIGIKTLFERLPNLRLNAERSLAPKGHEFRKPPALVVEWSMTQEAAHKEEVS
jgi:cytochrome P450